MATNDKPPRNVCNNCKKVSTEVQYDQVSRQRLCKECWASVDPHRAGFTDPEHLTDQEKRVY